jgi:hypothetical protein
MQTKLNENKKSNDFEYSIFTNYTFNKPNKYTLCRRFYDFKWYEKLIFKYEYVALTKNGIPSYGFKRPFITESIDEINKFMEWNINKDNNTL